MSKIAQALESLDPNNAEQWTADGLPRIDVIEGIVGTTITRKEVTDAKPGFSRAVALKSVNVVNTTQTENNGPQANPSETSTEGEGDSKADTKSESSDLPEGETKQPDLGVSSDPESEDVTLEQKLQIAKAKLEAEKSKQAEVSKAVKEAQQEYDALLVDHEKEVGTTTTQEAIQQYLESQKKQNQERNNIAKQLQDSGIDLKKLTNQLEANPLDQSFKNRK